METPDEWTLVGKVIAGEATAQERRQFEDWLAANPAQRPVVDSLRRIWQTPGTDTSTDRRQMATAFEQLQQRIDAENLRTATRWPLRLARPRRTALLSWVAAASVLTALVSIGWWQFRSATDVPAVVQQSNPKGTRSKIRLADGTTVWLNADSRLSYPKAFDGRLREVSLTGEAFFQVAHNPAQPFVVRLKTGSVRVLGTSFNIRAYPNDSTVETSVVTGRVAFVPKPATVRRITQTGPGQPAKPADTLFLTPNLKAIQSIARQQVSVGPTVAANQIAWTEARLVFRDTPMGEVAKTLERWYGTPVTLERESLRHCPLTGTFRNQSLKEVISLIAMTNKFDYELTASHLTIKGQGCSE